MAEPWKHLIGIPGRAAWRVSADRIPERILNAQQFVLASGGRTRKILSHTHKRVIEAHQQLADRRDRERRRLLFEGSRAPKDPKHDTNLQPVLYGPDESLAFFHFRLVPNYLITSRVLNESFSLLGRKSFEPKRVLDFGIGAGSASAAALDIFGDSIEWIHGIDASETMRHGAQTFLGKIIEEMEGPQKPRVTTSAHLSAEVAPPAFDLVLFTYTATEFVHNAAILSAAAILWGKLRPGGLFVMIEPGTPDGFSSIRAVRNMLLDCAPSDMSGSDACHTIAPCTHNGPCPLDRFKEYRVGNSEDDDVRKGFCGFVQTMSSFGNHKGEKLSYFVGQKRVSDDSESKVAKVDHIVDHDHDLVAVLESLPSANDVDLDKILSEYLDSDEDELGLELVKNSINSYGRIIHAPKKKKGHVLIDCCADGTIVRHNVSKRLDTEFPGLYNAARKSRWGGLWPNMDRTKTGLD